MLWFRVQQLAGQRGATGAFRPGWSHQPGPKALHLSRLVAPTGTNTKGSLFCPGWWISWGNGPSHEAKWTECKGPRAQNVNFVLLRRPRQIAASTLLYILLTQGVKGAPLFWSSLHLLSFCGSSDLSSFLYYLVESLPQQFGAHPSVHSTTPSTDLRQHWL